MTVCSQALFYGCEGKVVASTSPLRSFQTNALSRKSQIQMLLDRDRNVQEVGRGEFEGLGGRFR